MVLRSATSRRVQHEVAPMKDGMPISQGGGKALIMFNKKTVKDVADSERCSIDTVKAVEGKGKNLVVVGIKRHSRK